VHLQIIGGKAPKMNTYRNKGEGSSDIVTPVKPFENVTLAMIIETFEM